MADPFKCRYPGCRFPAVGVLRFVLYGCVHHTPYCQPHKIHFEVETELNRTDFLWMPYTNKRKGSLTKSARKK
jgi:hypothetical protein